MTAATETPATSTRVCLKNIPVSFTESQLSQFLQSGSNVPLVITDAKILRRKSDQKSRQLAFVGLASQQQAAHVVQHFHQTYCRTSRLSVEYALAKNDTILRPWSKHSKGSTNYEKLHGKEVAKEVVVDVPTTKKPLTANERRKQEFLAAMGVGTDKTKFWANDDGAMGMDIVGTSAADTVVSDKKKGRTSDKKKKGTSDKDSDDSDDESSVASDDSGGEGADILKSSSTTKRTTAGAVLTDLDFLKSKSTAKEELESDNGDDDSSSAGSSSSSSWPSSDSDDDSDSDSDDDDDEVAKKTKTTKQTTATKTTPALTKETTAPMQDDDETELAIANDEQHNAIALDRLFVRNLPFSTTEEELREHFELNDTTDKLLECHIPVDDQKRNKGFAFVAYATPDAAARAKDALDGTDFQGRLLHILPARKNVETILDPNDPSLTYKQKQEVLRKQQAAGTKQGWSASFVRGDAVVDNLAQRLGLRKGDVLDVKGGLSSGDAAVRLALGETQIIEENRQYFANHGVDMEALVSAGGATDDDKKETELKRSTTAILVKNLPFETEKDELARLFGDAPERILLPPSRTIALVQYGHSGDAKRAFKKLAYKRFKHVPLYLEWAPLAAAVEATTGETTTTTPETTTLAQNDEAPDDTNTSFSIYIKNLNFTTTEDDLRATFEKQNVTIRAVKIPLKAAPIRRDDETPKFLAMGFGFVECDSDASVRKALKTMQGTVLDGHALELKRSSKPLVAGSSTANKTPKPAKGKNPTKIMCRNVPFQATRKEILQLFGSFGQLKKVRLPRKFDGQHRGFAFCEFLTSQEAQAAMTSLSRTHLYGRHLVLEWADDKEDMDVLRGKAKRDLEAPAELEHKKSKKPLNKKIKFNFD